MRGSHRLGLIQELPDHCAPCRDHVRLESGFEADHRVCKNAHQLALSVLNSGGAGMMHVLAYQ